MARVPEVADLSGYLTRAAHVLETQLSAALGEIGLTVRMQCVLRYAVEAERTQIQLAELAYLDKTTMVATVDALEQAGYAVRTPTATDRRVRIIAVTPAGARAAAKGQQIVDRVHAQTLSALPPSQRRTFTTALATLVEGPLSAPIPAQPVRRPRHHTT